MKEIEIGAFEAKNRLSALLDEAAKGQRVWITKRGKRVALLSSGRESEPKETPEEVLTQFRNLRRSARKGLESLRSLVEEGRRCSGSSPMRPFAGPGFSVTRVHRALRGCWRRSSAKNWNCGRRRFGLTNWRTCSVRLIDENVS